MIIWQGGWVFAAGAGALALVCVHELSVMLERARPVRLAAMIGVLGLVVAGTAGDERQVLLALVATVPLTFLLAVAMPAARADHREHGDDDVHHRLDRHGRRPRRAAARARPRRRARRDDPARHVRRRHVRLLRRAAFGRRKLAPTISPNKTIEGLACGIVVGTLAVFYWSQTYDGDWISNTDGLLLGLAAVIAAPIGDLFESLVKRDMGTKDTGTLFGAHGGALDRVDAALFALVAGYYVWLALA